MQYLRDALFDVGNSYVTCSFGSTTNDEHLGDGFRFRRIIDHLFDIGESGA